ncbi:MAG: PLP-dependent transferase [Candidatus Hydrogenedentota bacterium]
MTKGKKHLELCRNPRWQAEDLGKPVPDSPHATSVALPLWRHVAGYEAGDPAVLGKMVCGYPRFVFQPLVAELFAACAAQHAGPGECCAVFPSRRVAERAAAFIQAKSGRATRLVPLSAAKATVLVAPAEAQDTLKRFWQHFGELVSSRQAQAILHGRDPAPTGAKNTVRTRLARLAGSQVQDVYLYPTGIAALAEAHRMVQALTPRAKSVQVGFPYVDVLKIQTETEPGVHFFPGAVAEKAPQVEALLAQETVSGVICEFAGNPLLTSVDVVRLAEVLRARGVPLIVDETLGTFVNVDLMPYADAVVTSLTKYFAGVGDVMGGSLVLNPDSPFCERFRTYLDAHHEDLLWEEDAQALAAYSKDFPERMRRINTTAETLCDYLHEHPKVDTLYYPKYTTPHHYTQVHRAGGGFGGLCSILLKDAARTAPAFYDALRVTKGPSLGADFTLACPYTLLAHYNELERVEALGVSRYLVRVSVGLEDSGDLGARFEAALDAV